ncbi:hypothetical protein [Paenibacillus sp. FSL R5-0490]|uniref:hypothetical protein n=1 Tax=Bacillales TaxID=1385 RepID=UPI00158A0C52|nr:hypothetical protein [Paenibacillus sp. FSL R5-0490]
MGTMNPTSEYILNEEYSAIAGWSTVPLFFHGTLMQGLTSPKKCTETSIRDE